MFIYLITHYLRSKFYFIAVTILISCTLYCSHYLTFTREAFTNIKILCKKLLFFPSLECHADHHPDESESRTAGNEKSHRRVKMATKYRITIVSIGGNSMSYLPTKICVLSRKLLRPDNVSKRSTRARATVP